MNTKSKKTDYKKIIYWISTCLISAAFLITGIGNLIPIDHIAHDMAQLGYPAYFLSLLGCWKILAAVAILLPKTPRLKEWAYAGILFDLTGAAYPRASIGEGIMMMIIPLSIVCIAFISWKLRPESRTLPTL